MPDNSNTINLQTDDERLDEAKKRLAEAKKRAATANTEAEVDAYNSDVDAARAALNSLIDELSGKDIGDEAPDEVTKETKKEQEIPSGHTITLGACTDDCKFEPTEKTKETGKTRETEEVKEEKSEEDGADAGFKKDLTETKHRLNTAHLELGSLQTQYDALKARHNDLKTAYQQNNTALTKEKRELQDKYEKNEKALEALKTLQSECATKVKQEQEARAKELEQQRLFRLELEDKNRPNEEVRCEVIKLALSHLGHTAPENFKSDHFYTTILNLYDFVKKDLLTRHVWRFALEERTLERSAKPEKQKDNCFAYELPRDLLKIQKIIPNHDYEIMGNTLLCMADNVALFYIKYVEDISLPEFFKTLLVYSLAASSAAIVTQNEVIARKWEIEANQRFCMAIANDTSQQAMRGVVRNPIYMAHFY